jgi:hypothetical protein
MVGRRPLGWCGEWFEALERRKMRWGKLTHGGKKLGEELVTGLNRAWIRRYGGGRREGSAWAWGPWLTVASGAAMRQLHGVAQGQRRLTGGLAQLHSAIFYWIQIFKLIWIWFDPSPAWKITNQKKTDRELYKKQVSLLGFFQIWAIIWIKNQRTFMRQICFKLEFNVLKNYRTW